MTIEADQNLLASQQWANNSNSANFLNNIHQISKLSKSQTTTCPCLTGNPRNLSCFKTKTSLKNDNQLPEDDRINYYHHFMKANALKTFKNNSSLTQQNLGEILAIFRRKHVEPQSMAVEKNKFQKLVFNPANQNLVDFLDELQKMAK